MSDLDEKCPGKQQLYYYLYRVQGLCGMVFRIHALLLNRSLLQLDNFNF